MVVAKAVGRAQMAAFAPNRIGMLIAGLEVPHTHLHVLPIETEADLDFAKADHRASAERLDAAAAALRDALAAAGHPGASAGG
jgi:diadenosine tetraphosphate (Ap4A) HIT family hydrolase